MATPTVIITLGDPAGIGPEVTLKAFKKEPSLFNACKPIIVGRLNEIRAFAPFYDKIHTFEIPFGEEIKIKPGKIHKDAGRIAAISLMAGIELLKDYGPHSALVTAPVCKESVIESIPGFRGHTEFLAEAFGKSGDDVAMVMVSQKIRALLLTRHLPLREVPLKLKPSYIKKQIEAASCTLKPNKIFLCNINPHCGEGGKIGKEETTVMGNVIKDLKKQKLNVYGPVNADVAFSKAAPDDLIVCAYHDQAMVPLKLLYGMKLVNLTCGLPYVRTSPAHGTAFDIAGKGRADPAGMIEALKLAAKLSATAGLRPSQ